MAYTPINWQVGDTITADKLNRCDNGWNIGGGSRALILNETVTTEGEGPAFGILQYEEELTVPSIVVTLDGVEYQCQYDSELPGYGDFNFEVYPFVIDYYDGANELVTAEAGTYSLKIEAAAAQTVEASQAFAEAVALHAIVGTTTFGEIDDALAAGRLVIITDVSEHGNSVLLVTTTDKTGQPLEVHALSAPSSGQVGAQTYTALSVGSAIEPL